MERIVAVGIDPSLERTAIVALDADIETLSARVKMGEFTTTRDHSISAGDTDALLIDGDRRTASIADNLMRWLMDNAPEPWFVYIERPAIIRSATTSMQLAGLSAVIRNYLRRAGISHQTVHGATLKAHAGVTRDLPKKHPSEEAKRRMVAEANRRWNLGLLPNQHDLADAAMLADMAVRDYRSFRGSE